MQSVKLDEKRNSSDDVVARFENFTLFPQATIGHQTPALIRRLSTFLILLISLFAGISGALASFANSTILAAHEYGQDAEGTITTWKQERSGLDTRSWHFGYDSATRLTSAILKNPAEVILKNHGWQYDPGNNRIASKTDAGGIIPSRHNKLNQLTEQGAGPVRFAGTIDEPGIVKVNGQNAKMRHQTLFEAYLELPPGTHEIEIEATDFSENSTAQSFEVEVADEPQTQLEYDLNGNLTKRTNASGITIYQWDALDRLITIIYPDTSRSEFTYDGLSRRVRIIEKDAANTVTSDKRHLWDDLQIAEERATNGTTVTKRFYDQGVELVAGPTAGDYTYRTDHLGSIREVLDSTGVLAARFDYSAWGEVQLISGSFDLDFRYTGHYFHNCSGLHLAPFRAYDAKLTRWFSRDPIQENGGINLYQYVENNPVVKVDPLGLQGRNRSMPFNLMNDMGGAGGGGGGGGGARGASGSGRCSGGGVPKQFIPPQVKGHPKQPQQFLPPTNPPQLPPPTLPSGHTVRIMPPTSAYPNGYWRQYNAGKQAINPATGKPPGNCSSAEFEAQTHIPLPPRASP